ncbi:MAG: 4-hydroxybenzoate octaprenyltransferase [Candidatus Omnitrophica bacterium]|nr:4-hydroxybenzoate octaprenyltransferase [Candidatus Omnitrophota bacterium]MBI3010182.1 4-hydroxybenzoate octaprenyltransferase [Candidatus Omnitrophota bacterium]
MPQICHYVRFVKLEHTLFSLPLIFAGALLGKGRLTLELAGWIILAAMGARIMAMGLNRMIDATIDAKNPRTKDRELPSGVMTLKEAGAIVLVAGCIYGFAAWKIAPICLWLSPIPVALFVVYPYLKRWTTLAHLGLGLAWSMTPLGGWLATSQSLQSIGEVAWLWFFSILWVAGFDIIYATMDERFDREQGLHSLPAWIGKHRALQMAAALHGLAFIALLVLWRGQLGNAAALLWLVAIGGIFIWQHAVASRNPIFAFFQLNGVLGFLVLGFVIVGRVGGVPNVPP